MILTGSFLFALSTAAVAGQVYKWVDAQGVTHFGAQPPEGQNATSINTAAPPPKTPAKPPVDATTPGPDDEQAAIDAKVKQDVAKQEAERKKFCETVRTNLAQLENNPRVRVESNGEVRRLNEEERQQRIAESKKSIEENCI
jgi:hypothetical protein